MRKRNGEAPPGKLPLVVVAKRDNVLQLTAVDEKAARAGLHSGLPLADARARVLGLDVVEADEAADRALLEAIADWCERFTPLVAFARGHGLYLDVTGCAHLFGGEAKLVNLLCDFMHGQEIALQTAIARTSVAASVLAKGASGSIIANGEEKAAVSPLPFTTLEIDEKTAYALKRAGLKTIGDVASRASSELTARFGAGFTFLLEQALGKSSQPIVPRKPLPDYVAERRFAEPVATAEVVAQALASLAATLEGLLEERGQGARRLEASFFRTDGMVRHIALDTGRPLRAAAAITGYFSERLGVLADPLDPGFGFDLIRLSALHTERLEHRANDFDAACDEEEVSALIDRLSARFGAARVIRFLPQDTHVPEAAMLACPAQRGLAASPWPQMRAAREAPRRPLHMLSPPERIEKVFALAPDGSPTQFLWRRAFHKIARSDGPERIAMEWWRDISALTRDYFQIEDEAGRRFWIFRDGLYDNNTERSWFVHGLFA